MGVASGCGYQEVGVASGSGWNLWVWLVGGMYGCGYQEVGVVGRRWVWLVGGMYGCGYQVVWLESIGVVSGCFPHITYYIPTALVSALFCSSIPTSFFILLK